METRSDSLDFGVADIRAWLACNSPVVIARRSTLRQWERNGFELGRDYERGVIGERLDRLEAQVRELPGVVG